MRIIRIPDAVGEFNLLPNSFITGCGEVVLGTVQARYQRRVIRPTANRIVPFSARTCRNSC